MRDTDHPDVAIKTAFSSKEQPLKALSPILVTLDGIVISVRLLQFLNAWSSILVKPSERLTLISELQPLKAREPILVTLEGNAMLCSPLHPMKA